MSLTSTNTVDHHHSRRNHHHNSLHDQLQKPKSSRKKKAPPPSPSPSIRSISTPNNNNNKAKKHHLNSTIQHSSQSSWEQFKSLLSCKSIAAQVQDPKSSSSKLGLASCGSSLCAIRDVVHGNTRVVHRSDNDLTSVSDIGSISQHETAPLTRSSGRSSSARHLQHPQAVYMSGCGGYSRGGMPLRKLSGCYECHAVSIEPASRRYPRPRTLSVCQECGEVFTKVESLELHQAIRHAVSELGPEDSGRNIVEIIFKSSWQKRDRPVCMIERILKVHNTPRTVARFEDYRSTIKSRALPSHQPNKKNPRCAADGNELLRFHCTTLSCPLGFAGSTTLCTSATCGVCTIIHHGFDRAGYPNGIRTTASSGRAHDCGPKFVSEHVIRSGGAELRAMLVCRVIAGRIRKLGDDSAIEEGYESVAGENSGQYGNLEELFVANPIAILPCFVVIYRALE